jgi:hypothetical protein
MQEAAAVVRACKSQLSSPGLDSQAQNVSKEISFSNGQRSGTSPQIVFIKAGIEETAALLIQRESPHYPFPII